MERVQVSLHEDNGRIQVAGSTVADAARPKGWWWLYAWLDAGWVPFYLTGNGERGWALLLEQQGASMKQAAFVSVKEKDDGTIKIKACTDDVPGIPDDWDKGLSAWTSAGWELSHVTGNREHGWGWLLFKTDGDATDPADQS